MVTVNRLRYRNIIKFNRFDRVYEIRFFRNRLNGRNRQTVDSTNYYHTFN